MAFLRLVEIFPPLVPTTKIRGTRDLERWLREIQGVAEHSDTFLVASLKDPDLVQIRPVEAAHLLSDKLGLKAAPVIVVRGMTRAELLSTVLSCVSLGLRSIMLALGDDDSQDGQGPKHFQTLAQAITEASNAASAWGAKLQILAPVDLRRLGHAKGVELAKSRLSAGASLLLAQPPTTDSGPTLSKHVGLLRSAGLEGKVLLNVFPFRGLKDIRELEKKFGWKVEGKVRETAELGEDALTREARRVVRKIRYEGLPGIYLSTRGEPSVAKKLLQ